MNLLQMSITGAFTIIAIVLLRLLLIHRLPKKSFQLLWSIAVLRLLLPLSLPSKFSLYALLSGFTKQAAANADPISGTQALTVSSEKLSAAAHTVSAVQGLYIVGLCVAALYFITFYLHGLRIFGMALPTEHPIIAEWRRANNVSPRIQVRISDRIRTPLTYGILHPVILLPKRMQAEAEQTLQFVLMHEYVHIQRLDTLRKLLLAVTVSVHWFNPTVWLMLHMVNRDIELICDETVIRRFGPSCKADYARSLIYMEESKKHAYPAPFPRFHPCSQTAAEERITAIMKMKKTTIWGAALTLALAAGTTTVFAANTSADKDASFVTSAPAPVCSVTTVVNATDVINAIEIPEELTSEEWAKIMDDIKTGKIEPFLSEDDDGSNVYLFTTDKDSDALAQYFDIVPELPTYTEEEWAQILADIESGKIPPLQINGDDDSIQYFIIEGADGEPVLLKEGKVPPKQD